MRIHSDTITSIDVLAAANFAARAGHGRVTVDTLSRHGSRSRRQAWEVKLTGDGSHSRRRPNGGTYGAADDYAATWDSWGWFLAFLYSVDPRMTCWAYADAENFHERTDGKFRAAMESAAAAL